jgi:hypothetical protein
MTTTLSKPALKIATAPAAPRRRWLPSDPIPFPPHLARGDYQDFQVTYDLDAVMSVRWLDLNGDLMGQDRELRRHAVASQRTFAADWPADRQTAEPDAYDEAQFAFDQEQSRIAGQREALTRAQLVRVLGQTVIVVTSPAGVEMEAPNAPGAWDGWAFQVLNWLALDGAKLAQEQLIGPKRSSEPSTTGPA